MKRGTYMKSFFEEFTGNYPVTKTLRFELRPQGETKKLMEEFKSGLAESEFLTDKIRADNYTDMKKIIDDYYIYFIDCVLNEIKLDSELINDAYEKYNNFKICKTKETRSEYQKKLKEIRKIISGKFSSSLEDFKLKDYGKLIKEGSDLFKWLENEFNESRITANEFEGKKKVIRLFFGFTTYFEGLKNNRENLFTDKQQMSSIAYRIAHDNMEKHFENCNRYEIIKQKYPVLYERIKEFENVFRPEKYTEYLRQVSIDVYNSYLGRKEDEKFAKGINQHINLYRQEAGIQNKNMPVFSPLYKQLMSKADRRVFAGFYSSDKELLDAIKLFYKQIKPYETVKNIIENIEKYFTEENSSNIYFKSEAINTISNSLFLDWSVIEGAIEQHKQTMHTQKERNAFDSSIKPIVDIKTLQYITNEYCQDNKTLNIAQYFASLNADKIKNAYENAEKILELSEIDKDRRLPNEEIKTGGAGYEQIAVLKALMDEIINAVKHFRPLSLTKNGEAIEADDKLTEFYDLFDEQYDKLMQAIPLYNSVRNHLTKKPSKEGKFKINFNRPTLLKGWDENKEPENLGILLTKDGMYYLAVMNRRHNHIFDMNKEEVTEDAIAKDGRECYKKIVYKQLSDVNKMFSKVFFASCNAELFDPSDKILKIRESGEHKINKKAAGEWIDYFKECLNKHPEWNKHYNFKFKDTDKYESIDEFYKDANDQSYVISFENIRKDYIDKKVKAGEMYLFQIYNKDFSPYSKGKPNLHTLYFKALFNDENLNNIIQSAKPVIKLNGEAEIFYRKASRGKNVVHTKNIPIENKNSDNKKKNSTFEYDIIKDKRFTEDKLFFHCPITINHRAKSYTTDTEFNAKINLAVNEAEVNIIGIDRGERHLLYYTIIDRNGRILKQGSLNKIINSTDEEGAEITTDYRAILHNKETQRETARETWSEIENIKELKSGYLSQVVHKLCMMMLNYNAVIVLENLNTGFKNSRQKFEKQVYQNFEKALIEKLNYFAIKDRESEEHGSILKGYQLTAPFKSFKTIFDQSGVLYYVEPRYTSKICPDTGFVNLFKSIDIKYSSIDNAQKFFDKMGGIRYNAKEDYFEFSFDYAKYSECAGNTKWTVCTHGNERYWYDANNKTNKLINVTEAIKKLLKDKGIDYKSHEDLREDICTVKDASFYKSMLFYFKLVLQLRYSTGGTTDEDDYILSPVKNEFGEFFDSRKTKQDMPKNADANGAYHISLKGLKLINSIGEDGSIPKPQKGQTLNEWLIYAQQKQYAERRKEQEA